MNLQESIRRILREENGVTAYKLTWRQLDKLLFKYLDKNFSDLKIHSEDLIGGLRITWTRPSDNTPIFIYYENRHTLKINQDFVTLMSSLFSVGVNDILNSLKRWCNKRLKTDAFQIYVFSPYLAEETIRRILKEENKTENKKQSLRNFAKSNGLELAYKITDGRDNYIKFAHDGDIKSFFKTENLGSHEKPFYFNGDYMFIDDLIVQSLNLPEKDNYKILGNFKYNKESSFPNIIHLKLRKYYNYPAYAKAWMVFGEFKGKSIGRFKSDKEQINKSTLKFLYKQIIDKYNLKDYCNNDCIY